MQPKPAAFPVLAVVFNIHPHHSPHPGEAVDHYPDQGPIAQPGDGLQIDRVDELPGFLGVEDRGFALLDHVLWPSDGGSRVEGDHLAHHQIITEHPNGG